MDKFLWRDNSRNMQDFLSRNFLKLRNEKHLIDVFLYLIAIFFLAAPFGNAGLPTEDPEVARLRAEFLTATTPTVEQLHLGKTWKCQSFNAIQGHMERYEGPDYKFIKDPNPKAGEEFLETNALEMVQNHQVDAANISFRYLYNQGLFMGQPFEDASICEVHTYLRTTLDGRLLVEIDAYNYPDLPQQVIQHRESVSVPGSIFPELRLMGFDECHVTP